MNELFPPTTKSLKAEIVQFNQEINNKKALANSLKLVVIKRMLDITHQEGRINRTNLAGKTGLNYAVCSRYVNTLVLFDWLRIRADYDVIITERGIEMSDALKILNEK
jgi:predicted transcriptional regulator